MPPDSPSFCIDASVRTQVQLQVSQINAILLPPGLCWPQVVECYWGLELLSKLLQFVCCLEKQ